MPSERASTGTYAHGEGTSGLRARRRQESHRRREHDENGPRATAHGVRGARNRQQHYKFPVVREGLAMIDDPAPFTVEPPVAESLAPAAAARLEAVRPPRRVAIFVCHGM